MTISIIIPAINLNKNLEECIHSCLKLDYPEIEIFVLPDTPIEIKAERVKVIPTGRVSPGEKRNRASRAAKGEILAFLDDDAWVRPDWATRAVGHFRDDAVAALGGPAVTPDTDSLRQRASGLVYASSLASGGYTYRYLARAKKEVDDYPSVNLFVRRSAFTEIGGFKPEFWPGEDTILCRDIRERLHKKIIYDPEVLVYHHRRPLFGPHLRQVANYALHRGYFVKRFPENSLKFAYFVPSLFVFALLTGAVLSLFFPLIKALYITGLTVYLAAAFLFSLNKDIRLVPLVFFGIILTHLCYGIWVVRGLLARRLKEE